MFKVTRLLLCLKTDIFNIFAYKKEEKVTRAFIDGRIRDIEKSKHINVHIKSLDKAASFLAYRWSLLCHVHHHCHRWWVLRLIKLIIVSEEPVID